jgi:SulP family sulfate permease
VLGLVVWPRLWAVDSQFRRQLDKIDTVSALRPTSRLPGPAVALVTLSLLAGLFLFLNRRRVRR